uniref:DUF632 domain-containing protein n=1 Tax=Meloidogyne hapla TaxID=6305 RepID=A0A1I8B6U7_MELHA
MIPTLFQILQSHTNSLNRQTMSSRDSSFTYPATPHRTTTFFPSSTLNSDTSSSKKDEDNDKNNYNQEPLSPELCKYRLLGRFEDLVNRLAAGWKYHVANTEGVKESWSRFEHFYLDLCSYTEG